MVRIAIVGGGPGGLFTSYLLKKKLFQEFEITLFEASNRLGGKVLSSNFSHNNVFYEAGVAELYDYSMIGPDPLKQLIKKLGLKTISMSGPVVVLRDKILKNQADIKKHFGQETVDEINKFRQQAQLYITPEEYYEGHWQDDNKSQLSKRSCASLLSEVKNDIAREYLSVAAHSDIATEPHFTNALNGLKNFLMDVPGYIRLYTVEGGIEKFIDALKKEINANIKLNSPVVSVSKNRNNTYTVEYKNNEETKQETFDLVIVALPNNWLPYIKWGEKQLSKAMQKHHTFYDYPAHYLRISILFSKPFWKNKIKGSYFMSDAFGGCCVYDDSLRQNISDYGVLSWLLAGADAVTMSNFSDQELIEKALASLPTELSNGKEFFIEGKINRWLNSLSGLPGGNPAKEPKSRHLPEPKNHPNFFLVGDYLFDSTLNGTLDSADVVTDLILTSLLKKKYQETDKLKVLPKTISAKATNKKVTITSNKIASSFVEVSSNGNKQTEAAEELDKEYFDLYDGERSYEDSFQEYFDATYTTGLIELVWGNKPPYRLLDAGAANGLTIGEFDKLGVECWGVENSAYMHSKTPSKWKHRNLLGNICSLPFEDNYFDFAYETCLCYVDEKQIDKAISELHRVVKKGIIFGSITSDMTKEVIEKHDIFYAVKTLCTTWEWSEKFLRNGFRLSIMDSKVLSQIWKFETDGDDDEDLWYPNQETMRYCFFTKV